MRFRKTKNFWSGFSLSELLISLLILAEIATFTIPKVLSAQQNGQNNAKAKAVAGMLSDAFNIHKMNCLMTTNTRTTDLTPYMNYLSYDTASGKAFDNTPRYSWWYTCSSTYPCMNLPDGGVLMLKNNCFLGGTTGLNFLEFLYDPDGTFNGDYTTGNTWDGKGKSIHFMVYVDGFLTTRNNVRAGSVQGGCTSPTPNIGLDPGWFSW